MKSITNTYNNQSTNALLSTLDNSQFVAAMVMCYVMMCCCSCNPMCCCTKNTS